MPARTKRPAAVVLEGLGGYVPAGTVTNLDLEGRLETSDAWIRSRTGIHSRRFAAPGEATSDMAAEAASRALASAGYPEIDLVILATTTPDHPCPATAPAVASRLGLGPVAAFDLAAVCSGFVYALAQANAAVLSGQHRRVLVIGADTFSAIVNPLDRNTAIIFGDGAGAVVVGAGEEGQPGQLSAFDLHSDGSCTDLIRVAAGGSRMPVNAETSDADRYFSMQGKEVFVQAVTAMAESSRSVLQESGWQHGDVDWLIAHQANQRILNQVAGLLGIDPRKAVIHLDRVGNTSAASIPLALADHAPRFETGDKLLLTAFGGGTTWGAGTLTWPPIAVADPQQAVNERTKPWPTPQPS
ncbi:beta-ketoacyl-ACP synthase 3 [Paenarthrobacter sp. NPDC089714]|uniref:beta-ketoacyl-ACP synthase 3 n=1 Tax=Paenarthrobacter sp. NPDC089714 TaxID=3364377 RepID=UPI0038117DC7